MGYPAEKGTPRRRSGLLRPNRLIFRIRPMPYPETGFAVTASPATQFLRTAAWQLSLSSRYVLPVIARSVSNFL